MGCTSAQSLTLRRRFGQLLRQWQAVFNPCIQHDYKRCTTCWIDRRRSTHVDVLGLSWEINTRQTNLGFRTSLQLWTGYETAFGELYFNPKPDVAASFRPTVAAVASCFQTLRRLRSRLLRQQQKFSSRASFEIGAAYSATCPAVEVSLPATASACNRDFADTATSWSNQLPLGMGRGNQLTLSWKGASLLKQHCLQTVSAEGLKCCQGSTLEA